MDELDKIKSGRTHDLPDHVEPTGEAMPAQPKKGIVTAKSLRVRKDHSLDAAVVAGLVAGDEVTILETWVDGKNTWAKLAPDQWAAMVYEGETLIKAA